MATSAFGNITASGYVSAIGNVYGSNVLGGYVSSAGNIRGGNINTAGLVAAGTVSATGIQVGTVSALGTIRGYNIVSTGGQITAVGNIQGNNVIGNYFIGNGSQLTGINVAATYGNANVAAFMPTYTGNVGNGLPVTSDVSRKVFVSNLDPQIGQGNVGDIWYQTY